MTKPALGVGVGAVLGLVDGLSAWRASHRALGVAVAILLAPAVTGQEPTAADPLESLGFFIGRWEGTSEGQPGKGTLHREYTQVLNARFIRVRNRNEYPAQEKNPTGEIHEDEGWFSFDRMRKRLVLRQFHVEGFVNQYVEDVDSSPQRRVFTTEAIENIPPGWRARETYVIHGPDEFDEVFELAEGDKPFEVYSRARLTRVK